MSDAPMIITIEADGKRHVVQCRYLDQNIPADYAEKLFYQGVLKPVKVITTYGANPPAPAKPKD